MATDPESMNAEPAPSAAASGPIASTSDERTMALLCHVGGILTGFIVPLIVWLIKKDQSKFVDDQGKEALNFQITLALAHIVLAVAFCIHFGLLNLALFVLTIVFGIMGAIAAQKGQPYRYPLNIRLLK